MSIFKKEKITCPFCNDTFEENCEYVDVEVGYQQATGNQCYECGAVETGMSCYDYIPVDGKIEWKIRPEFISRNDIKDGWHRLKPEYGE